MDKKTKVGIIGGAIAVLIIAIVAIITVIGKLTPSKVVRELSDYYQAPEGQALIIMDDVIYDKYAKVIDGVYYIDLDTVTSKFNKRFYFDTAENVLVYTTPTEVIKVEVGSKDYTVNKNKMSKKYPIVKREVDEVYIALEFVGEYSDIRYDAYPNYVLIQCTWGDYLYATVKSATQIRTEASIKSDIVKELAVDDQVMIINNGGNAENGFITVMSKDGVRGYAQKKQLSDSFYAKVESSFDAPVYTNIKKNYKINLTWHQVTNQDANKNLLTMLASTKGVTTISPTWFRINSAEGTLSSLASKDYVDQAHNLGLEVWGLVDNFDPNVDTHEVLSKTSNRERLVNEIIAQAIQNDLDGINIDFENLKVETGPHYIEFLRELSAKCRNNQIILSSDTYVPAPYSKFYDRAEQGNILDYVIIMAYDEHHSASEEAGSVASYNFVKDAIANTIEQVPEDKIIMAVPFYTRVWKESVELGKTVVTSEAMGMSNAENILKKNNVTAEWDDTTKQYYAQYEKDGATYKVWLEEDESIDAKLKLIYDAELAGVASWRLGFEKASIWDIILKYIN